MKKIILLILLVSTTLLIGCSTSKQVIDRDDAYELIISNIDDNNAIAAFLEDEKLHGNDINGHIKGGDSVLLLVARYSTNIEVLKTVISYYPDIYQENENSDMNSLNYLSRRDGEEVKAMHKYLLNESIKYELKKKANSTKDGIVKGIFNKF